MSLDTCLSVRPCLSCPVALCSCGQGCRSHSQIVINFIYFCYCCVKKTNFYRQSKARLVIKYIWLCYYSKGQHDIDLDEVVDLLVLNFDSTDLEVVDLLVVEVLDAAEFLHLGLLDVLNLNHSTFLESFLYGASL